MEAFRVQLSGMPKEGDKEMDKLCTTFSAVLLNEAPGQLILARDALLWKQSSGGECSIDAGAEDFHFPLDAFEEEVLLTAADVEDGRLFGVKLFLSSCEEEVNFMFQETPEETSKLKSQQCFRLLKNLLETKRLTAGNSSSQMGQRENESMVGNSRLDAALLRDVPRKKKRKDRRKSLSLDAFQPLLAAPEEDECERNNMLGDSLASPEGTTASYEKPVPIASEQVDVISLARRLARCSNQEEYQALTVVMLETHGYEISAVRTPTKHQLEESPPSNRHPKKKELVKLKPIVLQMTKAAKEEREMLQAKTRVRIVSPRTRKGSIQYFEATSNQRVPVEEYAFRYYESILGREARVPHSEPENTDVELEGKSHPQTNEKNEIQLGAEQLQVESSNGEDIKARCVHFKKQIAEAERIMNHTFDKALEDFRQAKSRLGEQLAQDLLKLELDETQIAAILRNEEEDFYAGIHVPQADTETNRPSRRRKKDDKRNRRKSVCLEHMEGLLEEHSNPSVDEENRVIWKTN